MSRQKWRTETSESSFRLVLFLSCPGWPAGLPENPAFKTSPTSDHLQCRHPGPTATINNLLMALLLSGLPCSLFPTQQAQGFHQPSKRPPLRCSKLCALISAEQKPKFRTMWPFPFPSLISAPDTPRRGSKSGLFPLMSLSQEAHFFPTHSSTDGHFGLFPDLGDCQ